MKRPKLLAPTAEWDEYIDRFLATHPPHEDCHIVQRHINQRRSACEAQYRKTSNKVWINRVSSCRRLSQQVVDYKYPTITRMRRQPKPKKVKGYYAVIH